MLLTRLKTETRAAHERIEADLPLMRPDIDLACYGLIVSRFHAFFCRWEPLVRNLVGDDRFMVPRLKAGLLAEDLAALGLSPMPQAPSRAIPALATREEAMGSLYVLEGSTLGGQIIARHLERRLGIRGPGTRYFSSYGREVGARWRAFQEALLAVSSPRTDDAIVQAALSTFDRLHGWLCPAHARVHAWPS